MATAAGQRRLDTLSVATFVALGVPDGMLGTAWPAMRRSFGAPVGDLGLVLLVSTAGSALVSLFVGALIRRLGVRVLVVAGLACAAAAAAGFAVAPRFGAVLGVAAAFGAAAGCLDGGLNTAIGLSGRRRLLNLLHGAYGVGTAVGPLVVTAALLAGSWRPAYVALLGIDVVVGVLWLLHRRGRSRPNGPAAGPRAPGPSGPGPARRRGGDGGRRYGAAITTGIVMFFLYTGLEVGAGQWETTFGRSRLHLSVSAAGEATFGYWAALTAVRIGLAFLPRAPAHQSVVRAGCLVAVLAAALIWWDPAPLLAVAGFVLMGASLAGVFPALIALTPLRLGDRRAASVIAWQVGAAAAGGAGVSALIGLLIGLSSVAVLAPCLLVLAVLLAGVEMVLSRLAPLSR